MNLVKEMKKSTHAALSLIFLGAMATVVSLMVLPIDTALTRELKILSPYIMVSFFFFGLLSLTLRQEKIMKVSFLAVAVVAFMLRSSAIAPVESTSQTIVDQVHLPQPISVSQYSTSNLLVDGKLKVESIVDLDADLVSIQGLTPDWADLLSERLTSTYPHVYLFEDIGVHGLGLFTKTPVGSIDSFLIGDVVQVQACLSGGDTSPEAQFIAVQTTPPVNSGAYQTMKAQIEVLAEYARNIEGPLITVGDFNNMPWSNELKVFQEETSLQDGRRSQFPTYHQGAPHLFDRPVEHIFYSNDLICLTYQAQREGSAYIGCGATFQLRSSTSSAMVAR